MHRSSARLSALLLVPLIASCGEEAGRLGFLRGELDVDPGSISFGEVYVGATQELPLSLSNSGSAPVSVSLSVAGEDSNAFRAPASTVVDAGGERRLTISFTAQREGRSTATLYLRLDDDAPSPIEVRLTGEGLTHPDCDDDSRCTSSWFDLTEGRCRSAAREGPCDDSDRCTEDDICVAGQCLGQAVRCADQVACTRDACDPLMGCVAVPDDARCDDDDPCTSDSCDSTAGCHHEPADGTPCGALSCQQIGLCVAGECRRQPAPEGYPCDDGNSCTVGDRCLGGACVPGPGSSGESFGPIALEVGTTTTSSIGEVLAVGEGAEVPESFVVVYLTKVEPDRGDCDTDGCCPHLGGEIHYATFSSSGELISDHNISEGYYRARPHKARAALHQGELYLLGYEPGEWGDGCDQERAWLLYHSPLWGGDRVSLPRIQNLNSDEMAIAVSFSEWPGSVVTALVSHQPSHAMGNPTTAHVTRWDEWMDDSEERTLVLEEQPTGVLPVENLQLVPRPGAVDLAYLVLDGSGCNQSCDGDCVRWCAYREARLALDLFGESPPDQVALANEVGYFSAEASDELSGALIIDSAVDGNGNACCEAPYEAVRLLRGSAGGITGQQSLVEHGNGRAFAQVAAVSALGQEGAIILGYGGNLQAKLVAHATAPERVVDLSFAPETGWAWDPSSPISTISLDGQLVAAGRITTGAEWEMNPIEIFPTVIPADHALGLVGVGCAPRESTVELATWFDRFSGVWLVDQPYHAAYEATYYTLSEDGSLAAESSYGRGDGVLGVTGTVYNPDSEVTCWFGDCWYSPNSATLVICGECTDALPREIVLGFSADPSSDSQNAGGFIISVNGEPNWVHNDWEWSFSRP